MHLSFSNHFVCFFIFCYILAVHGHDATFNDCSTARTCSECISISNQCKWCTKEPFPANVPRCRSQFFPSDCPGRDQVNPQLDNFEIVQNREFSDVEEKQVQLRPQKYQFDVRPGKWVTLNIDYKQAEDYPMDLYYLMDLSYTMLKHKKSVSGVGAKLATKMQTTTKDFRIGFGSFVDKETIPFASYSRKTQKYEGTMIEYAHSFINHMALKGDAAEFERRVEGAEISGNLDSPEGTLDALMQVMVCDKEIGWRPQSDKIIVVATDAEFHYGGDGRIGGIMIPNDGKCHVQNGRYTESVTYDYPTMHHIAEVAQKKKFNLVFSVHKDVVPDHQILAKIIGPNSRVANLTENDDSIAELIEEVYRNISTSVQLDVEYKPDNVDIEIWSNCADAHDPKFYRTNTCRFQGRTQIPFQIRLRLRNCSEPGEFHKAVVRIGLLNKNETVEIALREMCKCECELQGVANSTKCSGHGTRSCGICTSCNGFRLGTTCECDPEKKVDLKDRDAACRKKGDARPCSGHGQCECAKCLCHETWTGEFCEVDESGCYDAAGVKCNNQGKCEDNACSCTSVVHQNISVPEYTGKFCECVVSNATCVSNATSGEICSGNGDCRCGRCECTRFTSHGRFCEKCPQCKSELYCAQIMACVPEYSKKFCLRKPQPSEGEGGSTDNMPDEGEIRYQNSDVPLVRQSPGQSNDTTAQASTNQTGTNETNPCRFNARECVQIISHWNFEMIDEVFESSTAAPVETPSNNGTQPQMPQLQQHDYFNHQCRSFINGCDVTYDFRLIYDRQRASDAAAEDPTTGNNPAWSDGETLTFKITPFREICPQPVNLIVVGSSAFGTVLLLGLLTICFWKMLTEYLDRREYERFIVEVDAANFTQSENPLYKDAKVQFRNPVFGIRDRTSRFFQNLNKK